MVEVIVAKTPEHMRAELVKWLDYQIRRAEGERNRARPGHELSFRKGEVAAFEKARDTIRDIPIIQATRTNLGVGGAAAKKVNAEAATRRISKMTGDRSGDNGR